MLKRVAFTMVGVILLLTLTTQVVAAHDPFQEIWLAIVGLIQKDEELETRILALEHATFTGIPEPTTTPVTTATPEPSNPCELLDRDFQLPHSFPGIWSSECKYTTHRTDIESGDHYFKTLTFNIHFTSGPWIATLSSTEDTFMLLAEWNSQTEEWELVDFNDDISSDVTNSRIEWQPIVDKWYYLWLTTYKAETQGHFVLDLQDKDATSTNDISQGLQQSSKDAIDSPGNNRDLQ